MSDDVLVAIRYIFILSVILILVAYWAGSKSLFSTAGTQLTNLIYAATGRTSGGTFANYPK